MTNTQKQSQVTAAELYKQRQQANKAPEQLKKTLSSYGAPSKTRGWKIALPTVFASVLVVLFVWPQSPPQTQMAKRLASSNTMTADAPLEEAVLDEAMELVAPLASADSAISNSPKITQQNTSPGTATPETSAVIAEAPAAMAMKMIAPAKESNTAIYSVGLSDDSESDVRTEAEPVAELEQQLGELADVKVEKDVDTVSDIVTDAEKELILNASKPAELTANKANPIYIYYANDQSGDSIYYRCDGSQLKLTDELSLGKLKTGWYKIWKNIENKWQAESVLEQTFDDQCN